MQFVCHYIWQIDKSSEDKLNETDGNQRRRRKRGFDVGPGGGGLVFVNDESAYCAQAQCSAPG